MALEPLARKYRPRNFFEMVGQRPVQVVLFGMLHDYGETMQGTHPKPVPTIPPALLFTGCRGSGKTSTARIVAAALNCTEETGAPRPCGSCSSCEAVAAGASPDVLEVDAASNGGVAEIRQIRELVGFEPDGAYRVVILDEAHSMSRDAFNAILKILEEPPERTVFILVTTEAGKILETVASRCCQFTFRRIAPDKIRLRLADVAQREGIIVDDALLDLISERADGAMRDALTLLEQCHLAGVRDTDKFFRLHGETDFAPVLLGHMASGDHAAMYELSETLLSTLGDIALITGKLGSCLRDVLVLHGNGRITAQGAHLARREALAARMSAAQALAVMQVLWDLRARVRLADARASLLLALAVGSQKLSAVPAPAPAVSINGNGHRVLSLDEMQRLVAT